MLEPSDIETLDKFRALCAALAHRLSSEVYGAQRPLRLRTAYLFPTTRKMSSTPDSMTLRCWSAIGGDIVYWDCCEDDHDVVPLPSVPSLTLVIPNTRTGDINVRSMSPDLFRIIRSTHLLDPLSILHMSLSARSYDTFGRDPWLECCRGLSHLFELSVVRDGDAEHVFLAGTGNADIGLLPRLEGAS